MFTPCFTFVAIGAAIIAVKEKCWHDVREFPFVSNFYKISNVITENYYANETLMKKYHVSIAPISHLKAILKNDNISFRNSKRIFEFILRIQEVALNVRP